MATSYKKTLVQPLPRAGEKITTDTLYWKNLQVPITKKEYGAITHIDFCPVDPYHFAVTNSTRLQIYSPRSLQIVKTISRFKDLAYSGCFRDDGKLVVAGGNEGLLRLFDVEGKSLLRVFKGHSGPVHVTKFLSDRVRILSGSDDNTVNVWDIPSEKQIISYAEHQSGIMEWSLGVESYFGEHLILIESIPDLQCGQRILNLRDYVRCGATSMASKDIILTGSYDHTVKMYDSRIGESVLTIEHGQPVESVLMFPSGGIFLSAGGNVIKVWDALAGGRLLTTLSHHHKTITSLAFCKNYQRLLSGSLDRHVKIYDVTTYQPVHTLDFPGSILSVGVSPDDSVIAVGTAEGLLSIQRRKPDEQEVKKKKKGPSYRYGLKGKTYIPHQDDHVIEHKRKEKLEKYDKFFKKFEHSKALDAALDIRVRVRTPEVTVTVLQELVRRGAIKAALAGRDEKSLSHILKFLQKNIGNPRYTAFLTDIVNLVVDLYSSQIGHSAAIDDILVQLKKTVDQEMAYIKQLFEVMGTMDTIFAAASQSESTNENTDNSNHVTLLPSQTAQTLSV